MTLQPVPQASRLNPHSQHSNAGNGLPLPVQITSASPQGEFSPCAHSRESANIRCRLQTARKILMQLHAVSGSFYCQIVLTITLGAKQPLDP